MRHVSSSARALAPRLSLLREQRYRLHFLREDSRQTAVVMVAVGVAYFVSGANDFTVLRGSPLLGVSLASRCLLVVAVGVVLVLLRRARWPRQQGRAFDLALLATAICTSAVHLGKIPSGQIQGPLIGGATLLGLLYFAQRGPVVPRAIVGFVVTIAGVTLISLGNHEAALQPPARVVSVLALGVLNVVGALSARSFEENRRERFEAERRERHAREELAVKLRELAVEKERAEAMSRARTAFLAAMSHEFRTPMNAVIGLSDVLLDAPLAAEHHERVRVISHGVADVPHRVIWSMDPYADQADRETPPDTVNPSLWRQARLNQTNGLFKVCDGIYQVRAFDMSNMTIVESNNGIIIIDPLISCECAADALKLYREWVRSEDKPIVPVVGVIITHSHVDHFGGILGVLDGAVDNPDIVAPEGFMEHAVSENVYAGVAMSRRAQYMYGPYLTKGDKGQVDGGLGKGQSIGRVSIASPNVTIEKSGQRHTIDGIEIEFHMTPGAEAPAEFDFYFPKYNAFCAAENAVHTMHNIQTLRGAKVRDALLWSKYMNETLKRHGGTVDHLFASHHWPIRGKERIEGFLTRQRDMYRYLTTEGVTRQDADVTVMLTRSTLNGLIAGTLSPEDAMERGELKVFGDPGALARFVKLFSLLDNGVVDFAIVTPRPNAAKAWREITTPEGENSASPLKRKLRVLGKIPRGC
jgi:ribonuclease BN (tRNA processing enzyme)